MMAEASAKLTGNIGVVIATTGPGGTNAIGCVVEAWVDSVPILVISGQVYSKQISKGVRSFGVQGCNHIWLEPVIKKRGKKGLKLQHPGPSKGSNCLLTPEQEKQIKRLIIDKTPDQLKLPFVLWDRKAVKELIYHQSVSK